MPLGWKGENDGSGLCVFSPVRQERVGNEMTKKNVEDTADLATEAYPMFVYQQGYDAGERRALTDAPSFVVPTSRPMEAESFHQHEWQEGFRDGYESIFALWDGKEKH